MDATCAGNSTWDEERELDAIEVDLEQKRRDLDAEDKKLEEQIRIARQNQKAIAEKKQGIWKAHAKQQLVLVVGYWRLQCIYI